MTDPILSGLSHPEGAIALAARIRRRERSAEEVVGEALDRAVAWQPVTNAFTVIDAEGALAAARSADRAVAQGLAVGPLHGVPVAVKDNILAGGLPTTAASRVLAGQRSAILPDGDAAVVARLRQAGAIMLGKTNMHEWAYGATNAASAHGPTRNPWDPARITGGSSGGSGAAVAARAVPLALGSDTGGSIRIPAAACGISGIKPTHGMLDGGGVLPLAWSFDCPGPLAADAGDLALALAVMAGVARPARRHRSFAGLRLAHLTGEGMERSGEVGRCLGQALGVLEADGAAVGETGLPDLRRGFVLWKAIMLAEATAYHRPFLDRMPDAYADGVRSQLEAGRCIAAVDYLAAQQARRLMAREVLALFDRFDALVLPTLPVTAPHLGEETVGLAGRRVTVQDAMTMLPWLANFTGLPAVSLPCGVAVDGLPVGMTLIGRPRDDFALLDLAERFQILTSWHARSPIPGGATKEAPHDD